MTVHVSVDTGCNLACDYSMIAGTRVLTADLEWINVEELDLDDEVVSFDNPKDREKNKQLTLNTNKITACWKYKEDAVKVITDKGEITVGKTHPFLSKYHGWRDASDFKQGQKIRYLVEPNDYEKNDEYWNGYACGAFAGDGSVYSNDTTKVATLRCRDPEIGEVILDNAPVASGWGLKDVGTDSNGLHEIRTSIWEQVDRVDSYLPVYKEWCDNEDYMRGWLAGLFDTDGSFDGTAVRFNQNDGEVKNYAEDFLSELGYNPVREEKAIRVSEGFGGKFDILTEIRPQVSRKVRNYEGSAWKGKATVQSVEEVGEETFYDVTVENDHTLIAEGLCSHNCYEERDRTVNGNDVTDNYDMDAIMEELENFKERYPQEVPGLHGGEPLLLRDEDIETIFEWVYNNYESVRNGEKYSHIQTNATLLRDKHIEMFDEYNVNVGISCDGPPELNEHRKAAMREDATDRLSSLTYENIFKLGETDVPVGVIVVVHEGNTGTDEKLETLLEWMDELNKNGISGHFNEMLPYDDINTELALSGERMKEVFIRTWEWVNEEPHRKWNPMREMQDNLIGNKLNDCRMARCDPFDAGAAKIIDGEGESTGCFDSETEILTTDGWKQFPQASVDDEVATINPDTQELEFCIPTEKQEYMWEGDMIHWKTKAMDCMVTPDHNMYTSTRRREDWWKTQAEQLAKKSEPYFKKAPKSISIDETEVPPVEKVLPETKSNGTRRLTELNTSDIDRWLQFLGWYIAEGHCHDGSYAVTITQDSQYTEEVVELLDSLGPTVTQDGYEWTISSKQIYEMVEQFGLCDEKYVPEWIKNLPPEKIEVFVKCLFKGDGTSRGLDDSDKDKWIKYTTTSEQLANDVQELLLRIGKGGSISVQDKPTKGGKTRYDVSVVHHADKTRVTAEPERVEYSGMVYDFTVPPNHTLLVRRNGRTFVTGNCGKTWSAVGDGTPFLQGPSNGTQYNDDNDREKILKSLPGAPETEGPDLGGCKGCRYWKICQGGCPSAGIDNDHRNRTRWCESKYYTYKKIEEDMRTMFPNITLVTDLPWNAETQQLAQTGQLDIGQFDAIDPQGDGKQKSVYGNYERNKGLPEEMIPQDFMPERSQAEIIEDFKRQHGEENVTVERDGDTLMTHADSDMDK